MKQKLSGRLTPLNYFKPSQLGLTINIGSQERRLADVNLDVKRNAMLDIVASVLNMPFKDGIFTGAYFTEVLEHLPAGSEQTALSEICGVLKSGGTLVMSVPNRGVWKFLDPVYYIHGHRHYAKSEVCEWLEEEGLTVKAVFTGGGAWEVLGNLVYCFMLYPIKKLLGHGLSAIPYLDKKSAGEFRRVKTEGGSGLFICAEKETHAD